MLRRGNESDDATHTGDAHLAKRIRQERVPVPHADIDRQRMSRDRETSGEPGSLALRDVRDGRDAFEQLVMMRDLFDALRWDAATAQHVGKERTNVVDSLRTAE